MFWFVNPYNSDLAVNLTVCGSLVQKQNTICIDQHVWVFDTEKKAIKVYEAMIKVVQEFRYRK